MSQMRIIVDDEEHATILAALRYYQRDGMGEPSNRPDWLQDIAVPDEDMTSLDADGIDELCERINCVYETIAEPPAPPTTPGGVAWETQAQVAEHRARIDALIKRGWIMVNTAGAPAIYMLNRDNPDAEQRFAVTLWGKIVFEATDYWDANRRWHAMMGGPQAWGEPRDPTVLLLQPAQERDHPDGGRLRDDAEAPKNAVWDREPCETCAEHMKIAGPRATGTPTAALVADWRWAWRTPASSSARSPIPTATP